MLADFDTAGQEKPTRKVVHNCGRLCNSLQVRQIQIMPRV
jgi:hypothetical protein